MEKHYRVPFGISGLIEIASDVFRLFDDLLWTRTVIFTKLAEKLQSNAQWEWMLR